MKTIILNSSVSAEEKLKALADALEDPDEDIRLIQRVSLDEIKRNTQLSMDYWLKVSGHTESVNVDKVSIEEGEIVIEMLLSDGDDI